METQQIGNKAKSLDFLTSAGFCVPDYFVIDPEKKTPTGTLLLMVQKIGGFPVACRSSSNLEDLAQASFAGLYETHLCIDSIEDLEKKIEVCANAFSNDRVQSYLKKHNIDAGSQKLYLIVQKMVDVKWSGVTFTLNPINGNEDETLTEFHQGLGEELVSGQVKPKTFLYSNCLGKPITDRSDNLREIGAHTLIEIAERALEIQALKHHPQDIEWAIDHTGRIFFLQTRNITQFQYRKDVVEHTNSDFRDGGVSARVCTPLMYSLYREVMQESMPQYLKNIRIISPDCDEKWINFFYGRPYWNLEATKSALTKVPGFDEEVFDQGMGISKDYSRTPALKTPINPKTILRALPVVFALKKHYLKNIRDVQNFSESFADREKLWQTSVKRGRQQTDKDFFKSFRRFIENEYFFVEQLYFTTIYNNSNAQTDFKTFLKSLGPKVDAQYTELVIGLQNVIHMNVQKGLDHLVNLLKCDTIHESSPAFQIAFREFIEDNYFHADEELNLLCPRWGEDPSTVLTILRNLVEVPNLHKSLEEIESTQRLAFRTNVHALEGQIRDEKFLSFLTIKKFRKLLKFSRDYLRRREEMREVSSKCYHFVRALCLQMGERLANLNIIALPGDIFFLDVIELLEIARDFPRKPGHLNDLSFSIYRRKMLYEGYRDFKAPNELGASIINTDNPTDEQAQMSGTGCSPGIVSAKVRVIQSLKDIGLIEPGEILVTRFTDPGWTPVFSILSGVITEVGGILSHASIISREFGIPAILNVSAATERLRTGQTITMDGTKGTIHLD